MLPNVDEVVYRIGSIVRWHPGNSGASHRGKRSGNSAPTMNANVRSTTLGARWKRYRENGWAFQVHRTTRCSNPAVKEADAVAANSCSGCYRPLRKRFPLEPPQVPPRKIPPWS